VLLECVTQGEYSSREGARRRRAASAAAPTAVREHKLGGAMT
jgi:hypothetical protein